MMLMTNLFGQFKSKRKKNPKQMKKKTLLNNLRYGMSQNDIQQIILQDNNKKEDIMSRISKYGYRIDAPKNQYKTIWVDSPCSLSFTNKLPPIDKAERFHYNSIYYRDDPFKPARKIDEFQKPDLLILEFRRNIRQAQKMSRSNNKNRSSSIRNTSSRDDIPIQTTEKEKEIVDRLCPKNQKVLKLEYDLYGNRSSFYATQKQPSPKNKQKKGHGYKKSDMFFTDSTRIDMSRPQNFNPGPGSYFKPYKKSTHNSVTTFHKNRNSEHATHKKSILNIQQHKKNSTIQVPRSSQMVDKASINIMNTINSSNLQKQNDLI